MGTLLAISLSGLRRDDPGAPWAGGPRAAIAWAAGLGVRAVQLDAAAPGMRARELDRSGRRDVAALLRRSELTLSGLDLWVPGEHLLDSSHVDRAVAAIVGAIGLAAEIAPLLGDAAGQRGRVVSMMLPAKIGSDVLRAIAAEAERQGVRIADHAWPPGPRTPAETSPAPAPKVSPAAPGDPESTAARAPAWPPSIGVGIDPAAVALAGEDIGPATARVADRLLSARFCDLSSAGRVLPGSADGRLDVLAYQVGLSMAPGLVPVVVDVRGLQEQDQAAQRMVAAWPAQP